MVEGAVAFIDCLGFKGVWNRPGSEKIIGQLQEIQGQAATILKQPLFAPYETIYDTKLSFLSKSDAAFAWLIRYAIPLKGGRSRDAFGNQPAIPITLVTRAADVAP